MTESERKKPATIHQPPSFSGGKRRPYFGAGGSRRQPEELPDELAEVPVDAVEHHQADDLEGDEATYDREQPGHAEIERPDLRVAEPPQQVPVPSLGLPLDAVAPQRHPGIGRPYDLYPGEDVLVFGHGSVPPLTTRSAG
ncbi:hypothetical protein [Dankookia sp. P2]|uniref:hypothetical protein n=1 Tax=Dankookia sp. P2 TaxID=3423955 RepID=UPI003D67491D